MLLRLILVFTLVPLVELELLLTIGSALGFWPTFSLVLLTAILGGWLAKREGLRVLRAWQTSLAQGELPAQSLTESLLVLIGGILLVTPGLLTDALGLSLLLPTTRRPMAAWLERWARRRFHITTLSSAPLHNRHPTARSHRPAVVDTVGVEVEAERGKHRLE